MTKIIFTALFACAAAAGAQEAAKPAAANEQIASNLKNYPEIMQIMKNLSVLMERGAEIPPERMGLLAPELAKFNGKVKAALGEQILAEIAAREKEIEDKARTDNALANLRAFRTTLQVYYGESGGRYPKDPADMVAKSINAVPTLYLPGHGQTNRITIIDSKKYDKDASKAIKDTGGWLYFSDPGSVNYGLLMLDCSHEAPEGGKFFDY